MKKTIRLFLAVLTLCLWSLNAEAVMSGGGPRQTDSSSAYANLAGAATKLITGNAGRIKVYGYTDSVATTGTFYFAYGTGTNCATGLTAVSPTQNATGAYVPVGYGLIPIFVIPPNQDFCIIPTAGNHNVQVTYIQE